MLYSRTLGRFILRALAQGGFSRWVGRFMDSRASAPFVPLMVGIYGIDLRSYEKRRYASYNDFFIRKRKPDSAAPVEGTETRLLSPCDGKLSVYPIGNVASVGEDAGFIIKHTSYTLERLLENTELASRYRGGYAFFIRLTVEDYHRYCYAASGVKGPDVHIPGKLHTVNPIANDHFPVYIENSRIYTRIHSEAFGSLVQMEVGALCVGRIVNLHGEGQVHQGEEKGYFMFGGSTVVLLTEPGRVRPREGIVEDTREGYETYIKMGEPLGH